MTALPTVAATVTIDATATLGPDTVGGLAARARVTVTASATPAAPRGRERRTRLCDVNGAGIAELQGATHGPIVFELNRPTTFMLDMALDDPKAPTVLAQRFREVQLWAGDWLITQGPIVSPSTDGERLTLTGADALWYLDHRLIGRELPNRLANPTFSRGIEGWSVLASHPNFVLIGPDSRAYVIINAAVGHEEEPRSLEMFQTQPEIHLFAFQEITVTAGPFGAEVALDAYAWVPAGESWPDDPDIGVELVRVPNGYRGIPLPGYPGPFPPAGYGNLYWAWSLVGDNLKAVGRSSFGADHPVDMWVRHRCTVQVAPNATETVHARLSGRRGAVLWAHAGLWVDEALEFYRADTAAVAAGLVAHAQDPAFGQSPLNIAATTTPTGVRVDRRYPYSARVRVLEALDALAKEGLLDYWLDVTPTARTLTVASPRRARATPVVLELGRNIATLAWGYDGENAASAISVVAAGSEAGPGQPEGHALDVTRFAGGLTLQAVLSAPAATPAIRLDDTAAALLATTVDPHTLTVTLTAAASAGLFGRLFPGDLAEVRIRRAALTIAGRYRIVRLTITPDDVIELVLNREV
jgi:hypothetical protein